MLKTYRERPSRVEATRWRALQGHPMVIDWPGTVEGNCRRCGLPWQAHGLLHGATPVCPGDWLVVHKDGPVEVMDNRKFKARYERTADGE